MNQKPDRDFAYSSSEPYVQDFYKDITMGGHRRNQPRIVNENFKTAVGTK